MKETDPGDLSRLHDIVVPSAAPWWPLATGWYVLFAIILVAMATAGWRWWRDWRDNACRRAALDALASASEIGQVSSILKRTALRAFSRREVAGLTGDAWCEWLEGQAGKPIPPEARSGLMHGIYASETTDPSLLETTKIYAAAWIRDHFPGRVAPLPPKADY